MTIAGYLSFEIPSVASGSHFIVFSDLNSLSGDDRELQEIAIASTNIWCKLPYAEELDAAFMNSCKSVARNIVEKSSSKNDTDIVKKLFETLEKTILAKDSLAPMYREEKARAQKLNSMFSS